MGLNPPPAVLLEDLGGWPAVLGALMRRQDLTSTQATAALGEILAGNASPAQTAAFVTALRMKGETIEELAGLVRAMLDAAVPVPVPDGADVVDTCEIGRAHV